MRISPLFDPEKLFFLSFLLSKWGWDVGIWYVHLVGTLDVSFGSLLEESQLFSPI